MFYKHECGITKIMKRTDEQLATAAAQGDNGALEVLIARFLKPVYGFAYGFVHNRTDAQDIAQEVFVKVWKNIHTFDSSKPFKPWLYRIAKNTCLDFVKKKSSIPFSSFDTEGGNWLTDTLQDPALQPDALVDRSLRAGQLALAVKSLDPKYAKVISLHDTQGLRFREIAQMTDTSLNTVKSRYRRALEALKKIVEV